ncbi:MAG: phage baseplate protein [Chryseobacterium sp.]
MSIGNIVQKTTKGISNSSAYINERANTLLSPKSAKGISGFIFDIPDTESLNMQSDITDHFTEDNSFIQDHIVNLPITITLSGFIGELVYEKPDGVSGAAQEVQNRLETVEAYTGDKTPQAIQNEQETIGQAQRAISAINQNIDRTQNTIELLEGDEGPERTRQEKAYSKLYSLWTSKTIMTVQTPWRYFESMAITSISFSQDSTTQQISDITVSLKEFRTAETKTVSYDQDLFPAREEIQSSEEEDQGNVRGTERDSSFLFEAREAIQ